MLFLAVFCGFLAEYQLEHKIEKDREKQYMESMLEDLASDTIMLERMVLRASVMEKGLDSLKIYLYNTENVLRNTSIIYQQNAVYTRHLMPSFSDQTATQLRNSGGMRLIRKRKVANAISIYWRGTNNLEKTAENFNNAQDEKLNLENVIFNRKYYTRLSTDSITGLESYSIDPEARLMTSDEILLISYANRTDRLEVFIRRFIIPQLFRQKLRATDLIDLIMKEYRLE